MTKKTAPSAAQPPGKKGDTTPPKPQGIGNNNDGSYERAVADRLAERPRQLGSDSVGNIVSNRDRTLTTNQGLQIPQDDDSLRLGLRGPTLLEDFHLREKITHFDHERIPERVVHARGAAAHGYFELTESLADVTTAELFTQVGQKTPVFV